MPIVLEVSLTLNPNNQIAYLADFTSLVDDTQYLITGTYLAPDTRFTFHGNLDITLTRPPIGVPVFSTIVPAEISTILLAAPPPPPAVYPYSVNDRIVAANFNADFEFSPGATPPHSTLGGAGKFKYWVDTSTTQPSLRQCIVPRASATYNAADWLTLGTIDAAAGKFHFNGSDVDFVGGEGGGTTIFNVTNLTVQGNTNLTTLVVTGATNLTTLQVSGGTTLQTLSVAGATTLAGTVTTPGIRYTGLSDNRFAFSWDGHVQAYVDNVKHGTIPSVLPVPIAEGGTAATTAGQGLANLGGFPSAGGTITGNLTVLGTLQNNNGRLITYAPASAPSVTLWQGNLGAMGFYYDGNLNFGGMDGNGVPVAYYGRFGADGSIVATNRLISTNGVFANSAQDFGLFQSGQWRYLQYASSWGLLWDTTNGNLIYQTPSGFKFHIGGDGSVFSSGSLNASTGLTVSGNSGFNNNLTVSGTLGCQANVVISGTLYGAPDGTLYVGSHVVPIDQGGHYCGVSAFGWAAVFAFNYFTPSSAEIKDEITPVATDRCLAVVKNLNPVSFKYKNDNLPAEEARLVHCGFTTQDVLAAVEPQGLSTDLVRRDSGGTQVGLAYNDLLALLWGAVRELSTRLETK